MQNMFSKIYNYGHNSIIRLWPYFKYLKYGLGAIITTFTITLGTLYFSQRLLIYLNDFPKTAKLNVVNPGQYGLPYDQVEVVTEDGETLPVYIILNCNSNGKSSGETIIIFCGNAGNMGDRIPLAVNLYKMGYNVVLLSYRGYGHATGKPNEQGLKLDAKAVLKFVKNNKILKNTNIILYGQSIGGAVAIYLAAMHQDEITALILENTFLSLPKVIPYVMPIIGPFAFLCKEKWKSEELIKTINKLPILFLSGREDEIVPSSHMDELYKLAPTHKKKIVKFTYGKHNDTCNIPAYWDEIASFSKTYIFHKRHTE